LYHITSISGYFIILPYFAAFLNFIKIIRSKMIRQVIKNVEKSGPTKSTRYLLHTSSLSQPFGPASGTPGRCANSGITATVFGGYGFVGRYFLSELGQ
jgi:hypothetical protein